MHDYDCTGLGSYTYIYLKADFVQGFVMMFGVSALLVLVIVGPKVGGLTEGISRMAEYMQQNEMAPLSFFCRCFPRRHHPHDQLWYLGTAPDDSQILRHPG